jgi:hypothetical protein
LISPTFTTAGVKGSELGLAGVTVLSGGDTDDLGRL